MVVCAHCGNENREGARFCRYCGQALDSVTANSTAEEKPPILLPEIPYAGESEIFAELEETPEAVAEPTPVGDSSEMDTPAEMLEIVIEETAPVATAEGLIVEDQPHPSEPEAVPEPEENPAEIPDALLPDETQEEDHTIDSEAEFGVLLAGVLLGGRYQVLGLESTEEESKIYQVEDLLACWSCGAEQSDLGQQYCETCGAEQVQKPRRRLRATLLDQAPEGAVECFSEAGYCFCLEALPAEPAQEPPHVLRMSAGFRTHPGMEREINEDSLLVLQLAALCGPPVLPVVGLFAVADGIGGNEAGEIASQAAVCCLADEAMGKIFRPAIGQGDLSEADPETWLKQIALAANQVILGLRHQAATEINMGCTLTAALVWGNQAFVVNAGDSRTYLLREGRLSQITRDHSVVARLVEQGYISEEEVYTHNQKSVIYRSLGDRPDLEVDSFHLDLHPGDRLLLCSDGLWEMVRDPLIEEVLLERFDPQQACDRLVEMANISGGEDNISVVVINLEPLL
jgi:serine/threonine protein phosphatase PrpC